MKVGDKFKFNDEVCIITDYVVETNEYKYRLTDGKTDQRISLTRFNALLKDGKIKVISPVVHPSYSRMMHSGDMFRIGKIKYTIKRIEWNTFKYVYQDEEGQEYKIEVPQFAKLLQADNLTLINRNKEEVLFDYAEHEDDKEHDLEKYKNYDTGEALTDNKPITLTISRKDMEFFIERDIKFVNSETLKKIFEVIAEGLKNEHHTSK